jgi:hypothetical protein
MRKLLCTSSSIVESNTAGYFQATLTVIPHFPVQRQTNALNVAKRSLKKADSTPREGNGDRSMLLLLS